MRLTLDVMVRQTAQAHHLPGLAVGIVEGDALIYTNTRGRADLDKDIPVTADTVFRIGSVTKTITAIGLMQLWEQGRFQLDDPINAYLRDFKVEYAAANAAPITFRHLLTHRSGVGPLRVMPDDLSKVGEIGELGAKPGEFSSLAAHYTQRLLADVQAGTKWSYDNHGYAVAGQLVEDISGQPFADYMEEHVFLPLGMEHSDYRLSSRVRGAFAQGYEVVLGGEAREIEYQEIIVAGAGSVFSSLNDMAKYVSALLKGGVVIQPETFKTITTPHFQLDSRLPGQGLGFRLDRLGDHPVMWHTGGWPGFVTMMVVAPEDNIGVLVLTNTTHMIPKKLGVDLLRGMLNLPDPEAGFVPASGPEEVCGKYLIPSEGMNTNLSRLHYFGQALEVYRAGQHLWIRGEAGGFKEGVPLYEAEVDAESPAFWIPSTAELEAAAMPLLLPSRIVFRRGADGTLNRAQFGYFEFYRE